MKKFRTISQQTPYNQTSPIVKIIEASSREEAFIKTFGVLTKEGYNVETKLRKDEADTLGIDMSKINLPYFSTTRMVAIRNIVEY